LRVDASDPSDEEISVGEIKSWVEAESHDGGCGARGAYAGKDAENTGLWIEAEVVIASWKWENSVEMFAFDPILVLAWSVASVFADFEHIDDDYFDFDGLLTRLRECTRKDD
jgi:hypothetical protein